MPEAALDRLRTAKWLRDKRVREVFEILDGAEGRTRAVGGIVRDTLLGLTRTDIDLATELLPQEVIARAEAAGLAVHPTGISHGTVTLVAGKMVFEVTTLRQDVATDGRRAEVAFGTDWTRDAMRRDFTMNALYCDPDGTLFDPLDGLEDCLSRTVRFIGDARDRIAEDYLRILRFFRFFATYGDGRPDADGLRAVTAAKAGLAQLSAERVWAELKRILAAPDPRRALLWMRTTGVLAAILPEGEKWGIDAIHPLIEAERELGWTAETILRLIAILPPIPERIDSLVTRLRLSKAEAERLSAWVQSDLPQAPAGSPQLKADLYRGEPEGIADVLRLAIAKADAAERLPLMEVLGEVERYRKPRFPVQGRDLIDLGATPGPELGQNLSRLEEAWIESGFTLTRKELLLRARSALAG